MAIQVETQRVAELANPLADWRWNCPRLGEQAFRRAVTRARPVSAHVGAKASQAKHIGRVAFLMQAGWRDAIELEFPVPGLAYARMTWLITDGNHRMAAALLRNDAYVLVSVFGHLRSAARALGVSESSLIEKPSRRDADGKADGTPAAHSPSSKTGGVH